MDRPASALPAGSGRGGSAENSSTSNIGLSRRVSFNQSVSLERTAAASSHEASAMPRALNQPSLSRQQSQSSSTPSLQKGRAASALQPGQRQPQGFLNITAASPERLGRGSFSFDRVQAAGGAQASLGAEPDYFVHTPQPKTSAVNRTFLFTSKQIPNSGEKHAPSYSGMAPGSMKRNNIERIIRTNCSAADPSNESPVGTVALRQALDLLKESEEADHFYSNQEAADWQERQEQEEQEASDDVKGEAWNKRIPRASIHYPICSRTARERCAYTTTDDWLIFALHSQYVRPLRDREWVPGEPCIIRKDSFELPPGACRYSESSCGLPATAFNSFVFPNPPRQFLMPRRGMNGNSELDQPFACFRASRDRQGDKRRNPQLTQQQLLDLERMLWFDPEPRIERPFRLYADSKGCLKGPIHDIGHIMRSGW